MAQSARLPAASLALALVALGCDAQVGPDYEGEPLASIRGSIVREASSDARKVEARLLWLSPDFVLGTGAAVRGEFPASFEMRLFAPPPDEAILDFDVLVGPGGGRVGTAVVAATPPGTTGLDERELEGVAEEYVLAYAPEPVRAGSAAASWVGGTLPAGYSLLRVVRATEEERLAFEACVEAAETHEEFQACGNVKDRLVPADGGFAETITIRMAAPEVLDLPDWN